MSTETFSEKGDSSSKQSGGVDWYSNPNASLAKVWAKEDYGELKRMLITANHILHYHGIVDAYGHISIRHPQNPKIYVMSGYMAPALVTSSEDLIEYWVHNSDPVDNKSPKKGYAERFIHGEMFRLYPSVNCVIHSHAESVLPYVTTKVPLQPVFHMAGFLGKYVPVFDIAHEYQPSDPQDMLIRNARFGTALAKYFVKKSLWESLFSPENPNPSDPKHNVVLMSRHGYTTHGRDIETAVYRAIYTKINAEAQTKAIMLQKAFDQSAPFSFMSTAMCQGCLKMNEGTQDKPWMLWKKEVENSSLYVNKG